MLREGGLSELGSTGLYLFYQIIIVGKQEIIFAHTSVTLLLPPIHGG